MKNKFVKIFFIALFIGAYSCSPSDDSDEIIIDYKTYGYMEQWTESQKINGTDTIALKNNPLVFYYNENQIPRSGEYRYTDKGVLTDINTTGFFILESELLYFISNNDTTTTTSENILDNLKNQAVVYKYRLENDRLILIDTTKLPHYELHFQS